MKVNSFSIQLGLNVCERNKYDAHDSLLFDHSFFVFVDDHQRVMYIVSFDVFRGRLGTDGADQPAARRQLLDQRRRQLGRRCANVNYVIGTT